MNWPLVPLLDAISDVSSGNTKIAQRDYLAHGQLPIIDQGSDFIGGYTDDESARHSAPGSVIIFGDHTKIFKFVNFPFAMGADGVKVLAIKDGWDARFVFHFLRSITLPDVGYSRHFKFLKTETIPSVPLSEQRRIAAILDHVETLRIRNNQEQLLLDTLPQHLFVTMFGDPDTATSTIELGKITSLSGGRNLVGDDPLADSRYRVLKISAVTSGRFKPEESKPLPGNYEPPAGHLVRSGDLLMSRANTAELVGAVALADRPPSNLALPDKIWRFEWLESGSNAVFYHALLSTLSIRRRISLLSSGSGGSMKNVSKAKLARMRIPHIPVAQQEEFARLVNGIASRSQQVRQRGGLLDEMASSLRSRAFRGEL